MIFLLFAWRCLRGGALGAAVIRGLTPLISTKVHVEFFCPKDDATDSLLALAFAASVHLRMPGLQRLPRSSGLFAVCAFMQSRG